MTNRTQKYSVRREKDTCIEDPDMEDTANMRAYTSPWVGEERIRTHGGGWESHAQPHVSCVDTPHVYSTPTRRDQRNYAESLVVRSYSEDRPGSVDRACDPMIFSLQANEPSYTMVCSPSLLSETAQIVHVGKLRLQLQNVSCARILAYQRGDMDTYRLLRARERVLRAEILTHPATPSWVRSASKTKAREPMGPWSMGLGEGSKPSTLPPEGGWLTRLARQILFTFGEVFAYLSP